MEVLLIVGLIVACIVISAVSSGSGTPNNPSGQMQLRLRKETKFLEGLPIPLELLIFEIKDLFIAGGGQWATLRLKLRDVAGKESHPVLCAIPELQEPGSRAFLHTQTLDPIPAGMFLKITEFSQAVAVPRELLTFPRSGLRSIVAEFEALVGGQVVQKATTTFQVQSTDSGYIEGIENREYSEELGIYLAMHIAAADGTADKAEADVVKGWANVQLSAVEPNRKEQRRDRINLIIGDAFSKVSHSVLDLNHIASELEAHATLPMKYEIIELCMDVMNADGVADPGEMKQLKVIAKLIGLDEARYSALLDKRLAGVTLLQSDGDDSLASFVGITPDMSKEQIKAHLNKEFRKWNARVTHDDRKIREGAEQMMERIAEARKKFL